MVEQFKIDIRKDLEVFKKEAPYGDEDVTTRDALAFITSTEQQLQLARSKARSKRVCLG